MYVYLYICGAWRGARAEDFVFVGTGEGAVVVYRVVVSQARDGSDEAPIARMDRRVPLRRGKRPVEQLAVLAHLHHVLALQGTLASQPASQPLSPPPPALVVRGGWLTA